MLMKKMIVSAAMLLAIAGTACAIGRRKKGKS